VSLEPRIRGRAKDRVRARVRARVNARVRVKVKVRARVKDRAKVRARVKDRARVRAKVAKAMEATRALPRRASSFLSGQPLTSAANTAESLYRSGRFLVNVGPSRTFL
jgi:hypothetical protein